MVQIEERLESQSDRLNKHDERLNQHSQRIQQLEVFDKEKHDRLRSVERNDEEYEKRLINVEQNYVKLENTILTENKETRTFFQSNMDKLWDLTKSRDELSHDTRRMRHEITKTKVERLSDVFFKLAGTGGILYLIVQALLK